MNLFSIAIDGPAGAGKSTIAKKIAHKLQCVYIDTGAMYRSVGYYCIKNGIDYMNEEQVTKVLPAIQIDILYKEGVQYIHLNGEDVSTAIRSQEVATSASKVATYAEVRTYLVEMQRGLANSKSVVMDGRDIGTVVLPNASLKIFLTASADERARRRCNEYDEKGITADYNKILEEIKERDHQDSTREVSPLKQAEDAVCIDSTVITIDEVVEEVSSLLEKRDI